MIIKLLTRIKKIPEITFELKQEVIDSKEIINNLIDKICKLESENKNLKEENKTLKTEIENIKSNLNSINEYIKEQKEKERIKN